jgi:hypothetical protein
MPLMHTITMMGNHVEHQQRGPSATPTPAATAPKNRGDASVERRGLVQKCRFTDFADSDSLGQLPGGSGARRDEQWKIDR